MKLKGYSMWVCNKCDGKFFAMREPKYCPYCRSTTKLGCGGYVKIDFKF